MKTKIKPSNTFQCLECKTDEMQHKEFVEHITSVHGFVKGTPCTRSMITALDGSDFYSNTFQLEIPIGEKKIKAIQTSSGPRQADDMMAGPDY